MRSISARSSAVSANVRSVSDSFPSRSMNTRPGPFTMISVMVSSAMRSSSTPKPKIMSSSWSTSLRSSSRLEYTQAGSSNTRRHALRTSLRARSGFVRASLASLSTDTSSCNCLRSSSSKSASVRGTS